MYAIVYSAQKSDRLLTHHPYVSVNYCIHCEALHSSVFSSRKATGVDADIDPPLKNVSLQSYVFSCHAGIHLRRRGRIYSCDLYMFAIVVCTTSLVILCVRVLYSTLLNCIGSDYILWGITTRPEDTLSLHLYLVA